MQYSEIADDMKASGTHSMLDGSDTATSTVTMPLPDGRQLMISTSSDHQVGTGGRVWWPAVKALCRWKSAHAESFCGADVL